MDSSYIYSTYYDWENDGYPEFSIFLNKLCKSSLDSLLFSGSFNEKNFLKIKELVKDVEHFMVGLIKAGYVDKGNIKEIMDNLMKIDCIKMISPSNDYYGAFSKNSIFINLGISGSETLTSSERTLLYLSHEISHKYHSPWYPVMEEYAKKSLGITDLSKALPETKEKFDFIIRGVTLLDEVISQDIAENVTYCCAKKKRPPKSFHQSEYIFNGKPYYTNFDSYGELEAVAISFLKNVFPLEENVSDEDVLEIYSDFSFTSNLSSFIIEKYKERGEEDLLIELLTNMGLICDASYAKFNQNISPLSDSHSLENLNMFNFLCSDNTYKRKGAKL